MIRLALFAALVALGAGCGGAADRSAQIADSIGSKSCEQTDYYIQSKLDGSKATIYDCVSFVGVRKCVTEQAGIIHDSTETVKLLFADTLSGGRPDCVTG